MIPNYLSHLFINNNNAKLNYKQNHIITGLSFIFIFLSAVLFLKISNNYITFKYTYASFIVLSPIFYSFFYEKTTLKAMSKYVSQLFLSVSIKNLKNNFSIKSSLIDILSINLVYLNPLLLYFVYKAVLIKLNCNDEIMINYEVYFRLYL